MLSKHPERCRYPHGHTRFVEVIVSSDRLDANEMVVDFKALKLAVSDHIEQYDHAIALNSDDPLRADIERVHPDSTVVFEGKDPTTEVIAEEIFRFIETVLAQGFSGVAPSGVTYTIPAGRVKLDRVRVWETPDSWAEVGD